MQSPDSMRLIGFWLRQPRWVHTTVAALFVCILVGLAVLIAIPAIIIGVCVVGLVLIVAGIRALLARARSGPSEASMRRNVRVIVRRGP